MTSENETRSRDEQERLDDPIDPLIVSAYRSLMPNWTTESTRLNVVQSEQETHLNGDTVTHQDPDMEPLCQRYREIATGSCLDGSSRFQLGQQLGHGGQGVVFRAECGGVDDFANDHLALKVFSPHHYPSVANYEKDMQRVARVASVVSGIDHGNMLDVQRFDACDGVRMMLMKQVEGYDLRELTKHEMLDRVKGLDRGLWRDITDRVAGHGPKQAKFMPGAAVTIIRECLIALDKLHSRGIVHGDVKPSNIMLSPEGEVKLIDTGAAFEWQGSRKPYFCTPRYAAPEVLEKGECMPGSDLASLGYVLIELLIGRPIFEGSFTPRGLETSLPQEATTGVPQPVCPKLAVEKRILPGRLREMLKPYSSRVAELCEKLIAPDPTERFPTARDAELYAYDYVRELEQCNLACYFLHELRRWLEALEHNGHANSIAPNSPDESTIS